MDGLSVILLASVMRDIAKVVSGGLSQLEKSGELLDIYNKWFLKILPKGVRPGISMSRHLNRSFIILWLTQVYPREKEIS
jgi:hypothetical protein